MSRSDLMEGNLNRAVMALMAMISVGALGH